MANTNNNKSLNVPNLRFPEFTGEWKAERLNDIAILTKGAGISKDQLSESGEPCILYGELYTKYKSEIIEDVISKTNIPTDKLIKSKANDVLIPCSGETAVDIATARCVLSDNVLLGGDLNIIRLKHHDGSFMSYQLNGKRKYDIAKVAQGVSVVHLYGENLKGIVTYNPQIEEQKKIVGLLSLLDERIATQNKIIGDLKKLKSAIIDYIFNNEVLSFRKRIHLSDVATKITQKNTNNHVSNVLSNSANQGIIPQSEVFDREIANEDNTSNYFVISQNDFVYNPRKSATAPYGPINRYYGQTDGVISPLYLCFRSHNIDVEYLGWYFKSDSWHKFVYQNGDTGVRHDRVSIKDEIFFSMPLFIHNADEQIEIAKRLNKIESFVKQEEQYLFLLESQKLYLLQQMFI
ncbi:restriction endonuclease subunit S [Bacteroides cellulosilyticus]|uniref:EcoKI restriction-modification system protein HsdS n=2 Tax=Bacteroides cellulosilyticus TaxID=246787 RepID=A0A0P0GBU9_9BACE|nr:restriction endonuclease subunit S [Bacteroides cellulosilyticus]ALJ58277.1 EcoKI restriction-modification system protein HsdS [Bacteroides cellulosilyticus]MBX9085209.1 restriction endonuclease subunit S [Bacteroides cellulosilyticus]